MSGFRTEWTVAGDATARTITLPLYNSGTFNCTVTWGDGSADSTITSYNDADRIHTYASNGTYQVTIVGECPAWSFNGAGDYLKITDILDWGSASAPAFGGFSYLTSGFKYCANIKSFGRTGKILVKAGLTTLSQAFYWITIPTAIPSGLFDNCTALTTLAFYSCFEGCTALTTIPTDLFKYNTSVSGSGFAWTFRQCYALTSIPTDLFRYNTAVSTSGFWGTFFITALTTVPTDTFRYNTAVSTNGFNAVFQSCASLSYLPADIFRYNTAVSTTGFGGSGYGAFSGCTALTSLPNDIFKYNTSLTISAFLSTFSDCTALASLPTDLFRYNTAVSTTGFRETFKNCSSLASVSANLFKYNTTCVSYYQTFYGCNKLQQNATIFYAAGEQATRFSGKTVDFTSCFYRDKFTGTQGVAPDLWNCTMTASTKTGCWGGNGNNCASLSNCADVPTTWGICPGFMIKVTVAGDATARTFTSPLPNSGTYNGTIDWGDGTAVSAITSYNDADRAHTYAADGTYLVNYYGEIPGFSFQDAGDKLKLVDIVQWGRATFHGGFGYLEVGFDGCTNLVSTGLGKILSKSTLTTVRNLFRNCTGLTSITAGMFDNCTYLTTNAYNVTFEGCTGITSITSDIFKYSTGAAASGFLGTFSGCTGLTSIVADIFKYNTSISTSGFDGTFYGCTGLTSIVADIFRFNTAVSTGGFSTVFSGCTGLTAITADIFKYNTSLSTSGFKQAFQNCAGLTSIVADIFKYNTAVSIEGFLRTFQNCTGLTSITADIFKYNVAVSTYGFSETFSGCTGLTSITSGLFAYNTAVSTEGFKYTFYGCTGIISTVTDLFRYNTAVSTSGFLGTFQNCTALASVSSNLFKYNTAVTTYGFSETFSGCTSLTTVPSDSFLYNTLVSSNGFEKTFYGCTALASVPELLFKYNTRALSFESCFEGCTKLQQNAKIFFDTGEESTRFADFGTVNFTKCFYRTSFIGTQGVAPELWNCTYKFDNVIKTNCWSGRGNRLISLSNYNSIPLEWGGTYIGGFALEFTVSGDETARTITLPLYNSGTFDAVVSWDDESENSTITSYNDADRIHIFSEPGTYTIQIAGACPSFSFNNSGDKLKLTGIGSLSGDDFEGFEYLTNGFYGCSNLVSVSGAALKSKAALTDLSGLLKDCINLTDVPELLLQDCSNVVSFESCFEGCTKLQQNAKIFFDTGEESTRFAGAGEIDFTKCFYRTSFTGTQGTAPLLWGCTYDSTPIKTNCWSGAGNSETSLTNYSIIPMPWGGPYASFIYLQFTVAGDATARTITLPLVNSGTFNCTVTWGDDTADSTITTYNDADRIHIYAVDGTYDVYIYGACPSFSFNNAGDKLKLTGIYSLSGDDFEGFEYLTSAFSGCSNLVTLGSSTIKSKSALTTVAELFKNCTALEEVPSGFFDSCTYLTNNGFYSVFEGCSALTSIPADLFKYNTTVSTSGFNSIFKNCTSLTTVPTDTFKYNTAVSTNGFEFAFYNCTALTTIPSNLFRYNTAVTTYGFKDAFYNCGSLTEIPVDTFRYNTSLSTRGFYQTFYRCVGLTSIPTDLFRYNTAVTTYGFYATFYGCIGLTTLPTDIFRYNTLVSTSAFDHTFYGCTSLTAAPELLFKYNTAATSFANCFEGCRKLQQNAKMFFNTGEEATRFSTVGSVDFTKCFYRTSATSTLGTAPALWDCTYGSTPTKTNCWSGAGNSLSTLINHNDIPLEWGGTYIPLEYDPDFVGKSFSFAFGSWEWYQLVTDANFVTIEFICSVDEALDKTGYQLSASDNTFTLAQIGGSTLLTCGSYVDDIWHKVKVERLASGIFKLYVNDVLVGTSIADVTTTTSQYITMNIGAGCKVSLSDPLGLHSFKICLIS